MKSSFRTFVYIVTSIIIGCLFEYIIRFSWWDLYDSSFVECFLNQNMKIDFDYILSAFFLSSLFFFWEKKHGVAKSGIAVFSCVFGIIQVVSLNIYYFKSFIDSQSVYSIIAFNAIAFIAYSFLFYVVGDCLFILLDSINGDEKELSGYEHFEVIISFVLILIAWTPWLIAFFPGSMFYDMCEQLEQYLGNVPYKLHPYFATLVMGKLFELGKAISGDNFGVFLYILLQALVCAFACSRVVSTLKEMDVARSIRIGTIAFYAIWPMFGASIQLGEKDILCDGLFLMFTVMYIKNVKELQHGEESETIIRGVFLSAICILCALFRNECLATCSCSLGILAILSIENKSINKMAVCIFACICMLSSYFLFNNLVVGKLEKAEQPGGWGSEEVLSIPIEQVGRTVKFRYDSVSESDKELLNKCFACGANKIAENYNPYLSDPLKLQFTGDKSFWKVWFSLLKKEPLVYAESIISSSFGYYSLVPKTFTTLDSAPTNNLPGLKYEFFINRDPDKEFNAVQISYLPSLSEMRGILEKYADSIDRIPIIRIAYKLGFYTWLIILMMVYIFNKKAYYGIWGFVPALLCIAVCIASPVNEYLRYYLKVIFMVPLLFGWTLFVTNIDKRGA